MSARQTLIAVLDQLPEEKVRQLLDFATILSWQDERTEWQTFGRKQLARAYGESEPEYTLGSLP
ncbi:MAG TPA: hypothetical protein VKD90_29745 [Gemmataceae bacterium]|nr:hypothetical protein [Gemmataceae bacterium]